MVLEGKGRKRQGQRVRDREKFNCCSVQLSVWPLVRIEEEKEDAHRQRHTRTNIAGNKINFNNCMNHGQILINNADKQSVHHCCKSTVA